MKRLRVLTSLVLALYVSVAMSGCTATSFDNTFRFTLTVPGLGEIEVTVTITHVFRLTNPTTSDACVQPKDADGNNIGGPLELPAGGSVDLPPGADSDKTEIIKKPPKPKPVDPAPIERHLRGKSAFELDAIIIQPLTIWPGFITSFAASGQSKVSEYKIAARNGAGAFDALNKLGQGLPVSNAALVAHSEFVPTSGTTAHFSTKMESKKISQFAVYVNGVVVASSATGMGGATIVYTSDGYGTGTAPIAFDLSSTSGLIEWVTTDTLGANTTRSYEFQL